jgi:hypothetical protein
VVLQVAEDELTSAQTTVVCATLPEAPVTVIS